MCKCVCVCIYVWAFVDLCICVWAYRTSHMLELASRLRGTMRSINPVLHSRSATIFGRKPANGLHRSESSHYITPRSWLTVRKCKLSATVMEMFKWEHFLRFGKKAGIAEVSSLLKCNTIHFRRLPWSSGSHAGLWFPSSRVQSRPKPLDFSVHKNPQHAFLRRGI
jgi:hypothetical protein